ncbi:MAG: hypothetical protein HKN25_03170 [Pyrinomonadaceae bacterium]|nr:hypothetical protein [Pyrinomonadaceae bacterium]
MNIKSLRKNYTTLSLVERHSLFVSAILRNDESEETAITNASPKMIQEMPDFTHLYSKVLTLLMIVMIHKADAFTNWQVFSESESERADNHSRLALYYFFVYSDAWEAICKQMKLNAEDLVEMMFPSCFLFTRLALVDESLRELAFTETEAKEFIKWFNGTDTKFEMTLENKLEEFRGFLELPEK